MRRILFLGILAVGVASAAAQNIETIKSRQATYKSMAAATKVPADMLKGAAPFDMQIVQAALDVYVDAGKRLPGLFPDDSKTGNETQALPVIWQQKDDFNTRMAKFSQDAQAAKAAIKDEASFKAEFPKVLANCGACHKIYRAANR